MKTHALMLSAESDRSVLATGAASWRMIEWVVASPEWPRRIRSTPLNLAIILDQSGSMRGEKLALVRQAMAYLLDHLHEHDRLALILCDDEAVLQMPGALMHAPARRQVLEQVTAVQAGGYTDLSDGVRMAGEEVVRHHGKRTLDRVVIFTDGMLNGGTTRNDALTARIGALHALGIKVAIIGVGEDANVGLLTTMAGQSGGPLNILSSADQISAVFRRELETAPPLAATNAVLTITFPADLSLEVLRRHTGVVGVGRVEIPLGNLYAGERRLIYTRVQAPAHDAGVMAPVRGCLTYTDGARHDMPPVTAEQTFRYEQDAYSADTAAEALLRRAEDAEIAAFVARLRRAREEGVSPDTVRETPAEYRVGFRYATSRAVGE